MSTQEKRKVTRRELLTATAAGVVGLAIGTAAGATGFARTVTETVRETETRTVTQPVTYTTTQVVTKTVTETVTETVVPTFVPPAEEYDVVVVGAGMAGLTAAIAAHEAGVRRLVVLEKGPNAFGSSTAVCGGAFFVAKDEWGMPKDRYVEVTMTMGLGKPVRRLIEAMAEKSYETVMEWLPKVAGVKFYPSERWFASYGPSVEGGGPKLAEYMYNAVKARGIPVLFETKAVSLLVDVKGRAAGVRALTKEGFKDFKAKAVILACGGFQANQEMVVNYIGPKVAYNAILRGHPYHNSGDGHRMAMAVRAKMVFMDQWHSATVQPGTYANPLGFYPQGIIVNKNGERFIDEGVATYVEVGRATLDQPDAKCYIVLDSKGLERVPAWHKWYFLEAYPGKLYKADTLEELAKAFGVPPERLLKTVSEFNAAVRDGRTEGISPPKSRFAYRIETPPFYGIDVVCGITMTFGGPLVDEHARVLDLEGKPIPGLYAVGELAGGFFYWNYPGGGSLTRCAVFGRIAGEHAASYIKTVT